MTRTVSQPAGGAVGNDRKKTDDRQVTFRLSPELHARLEATAKGLELDISSLLRTMIRECLPTYEDRAEAIRLKETKGAD